MNTQEQPVTASLVAEAQRLDFLPAYFGPRLMMGSPRFQCNK